jgi:hypothetical protein
LFIRLEQEKTEALAVNWVHPVSGDEPWCGPHSWQDLASEPSGGGGRQRRINRQMYKCCVHRYSPISCPGGSVIFFYPIPQFIKSFI